MQVEEIYDLMDEDANYIVEMIFSMFDKRGSGCLDFTQFILATNLAVKTQNLILNLTHRRAAIKKFVLYYKTGRKQNLYFIILF